MQNRERIESNPAHVGSNSLLVNVMEMRQGKFKYFSIVEGRMIEPRARTCSGNAGPQHGKSKYFEIFARPHDTCVIFSRKNADIKKLNKHAGY